MADSLRMGPPPEGVASWWPDENGIMLPTNAVAFYAALSRAREEGARLGLEAAAGIVEQWRDKNKASAAKARSQGNRGFSAELDTATVECNAIAKELRALDPAKIAGEK
jgi:hypothetical protein